MSNSRHTTNGSASGIARHGQLRRSHPFRLIAGVLGVALAVVLVSGLSVGSIALAQLRGNIDSVALVGEEDDAAAPSFGSFEGGFNMLIVGSDACETEGGCDDREDELNDVTMLMHVSEDQTSAVAVSFPRDLVVPIPECPMADGSGNHVAMEAQPINVTLSYGGLSCTVQTVEALTGLEIPYAGLIKFNGVIEMSNAVGGVPVCITGPFDDPYAGLTLPEAGTYSLMGSDALAFLRSRHGVGDGSDLGRISSQQVFLSSLVRTIKSDTTLSDPSKLFGLATAATRNMTLSNSLSNLNTMAEMALVLKDIPLEKITFVQYPGTTGEGGVYEGKVAPITDVADRLFAALAADEAFTLDSGTGRGSVADPDAPVVETPAPEETAVPEETPEATATPEEPADPAGTPEPEAPEEPDDVISGVLGQTAADYTCSKVN